MNNKDTFSKNWTSEHVMAYIYLALADADLERSKEERELIFERLSKRLNDKRKALTLFKEVSEAIKGHAMYDRPSYIQQLVKKFHFSEELKNAISSDAHELILTDEKIHTEEMKLLRLIRESLN